MRFCKAKTVVLLLIFISVAHSQTLKVYINGNFQIHANEPLSTNTPVLSTYFNDNFSYGFGLNYRFIYSSSHKLLIGFDYNKGQFNSKNNYSAKILGEKIIINSGTIYMGLGKFIPSEHNIFFYAIMGVSIKTYKGYAKFDGMDVIYNYGNNISMRLGTGIDREAIFNSPFSIGAAVNVDFGAVKREYVYFYYQGDKIARAAPGGNLYLRDIMFSIKVYLIYQFDL